MYVHCTPHSFQNDEEYNNLFRESVLTLICEEDGSDLYGGGEAGG